MKGVVFNEFLEMVESKYGLTKLDQVIEGSDLKSKGIYTSIGNYESHEFFQLIGSLSKHTSIPTEDLLYDYGNHFFAFLAKTYPQIFKHLWPC